MLEWVKFLADTWQLIFTEIYDKMILPLGDSNSNFSVGGFIVAALIVGLVISVFWKGAKT